MGEPFHILLTCAGRRVALVRLFGAALVQLGLDGDVCVADASGLSSALQLAQRGFRIPRCSDPQFVPRLLEICREQAIRLIVPCIDPELGLLAAARDRFREQGVRVVVSDPAVIEICTDKIRTHSWLRANGFPTVRQAAAAEVLSHPEDWSFPAILKPVCGSASRGVSRVERLSDLESAIRVDGEEDWIVQELARGDEYTVSVFVDGQGQARCAVPRRRIEIRAGEVSKGITERVAPVEALARALAEALPGVDGPINIQMFYDETLEIPRVIEINPRFGGGFPLSCEAGAHMPRWLIEQTLGLEVTAHDNWREGLVMLRYDDAVFVDRRQAGLE